MKVDGRKLRVAACGGRAIDGHHVSRCRECRRIYQRKYRDRIGYKRLPAQCVMCGLSGRNSRGIPVYRYPLIRKPTTGGPGRRSFVIASIGLCDSCIQEHARPSPSYIRLNGSAWGMAA
jgi:hypothetical protein